MGSAMGFFFLVFIPSLIHLTNADARIDIVLKACNKIHVRNAWHYADTYSRIIDKIRPGMNRSRFVFAYEGNPPERLFVMAQCLVDLSAEECLTCFGESNNLLNSCFAYTGGRVYLDGCFIRAENYSFYEETLTPDDSVNCSHIYHKSQAFSDMARQVVGQIVKRAPNNKGYAIGYKTSSHNISVYAIANCWKTLDEEACALCLANASLSALTCLPSTEGRALNAGCFLRYSDYPFLNLPNPPLARNAIFSFYSFFIAGITVCMLAVALGVYVGRVAYTGLSRQQSRINGLDMESSLFKRSLQFKYSTLEKATQHFNLANKLGQGGCGEVFKGTLADGREIAIKRLFITGKNQIRDVCNEMDVISRAQHKNLVRFLGSSLTNHDSLLVYEFLANKSLDCILFDSEKKKELNWKKRLVIIIGTAEGLEYLHKGCQVRIIHRDIKASNILLDLRYRPKISDFGLARFYSSDRTLISTAIAGTLGYMAPEYLAQGRLTEKVDVYSFGILALEIISGVQNNKFKPDDTLDTLVTTAWKHFQSDTVSEIIDESMEFDDVEEIKRVLQVGLLCTQELPSLRPTMTMILQMLTQRDIDLPIPTKPPFTEESMDTSRSCTSSRRRQSSQSSISFRSHNIDDERR